MSYPDPDALITCAFKLWREKTPAKRYHVLLYTDDPSRYGKEACLQTLSPWLGWTTIVQHADARTTRFSMLGLEVPPADVRVFSLIKDKDLASRLQADCRQHAIPFLDSSQPEYESFDGILLTEVLHFLFEFGGRNDWDGAPPKHSAAMLRYLSQATCIENYPTWATDGLNCSRTPARALDVGCGPISILRWGAVQGDLRITGLDPLIEMYALVRARHGYDRLPAIQCDTEIGAFAENLDDLVEDQAYDLIFTQNALDHTQDPERVIASFERKLTRNGRVAIAVATREGSRQNWNQLHKTDIDILDGRLVFRHQHSDWKPLLPPTSQLAISKVCSHSPDWLSVLLEFRQP